MCQAITRPAWERTEEEHLEILLESWTDESAVEALQVMELERQKRVEHNRKRAYQMSRGVKQNQLAYDRIAQYLAETDRQLTDDEAMALMSYRRAVQVCCQYSLWREHDGGSCEFIAAHTCKHKYCNVCNARRCKEIRKRYRLLFDLDPNLLKNYDFMHLTLTVPHSASGGWMGKNWYADELMKKFNLMRKRRWWKDTVYAGEFGVECTKNGNGLHIHIHALVLVKRFRGNRNELHRNVLLEWNKLTAWSGAQRQEITAEHKEAMLKSNKSIEPDDLDQLNPQGATMIGLETVYLKSSSKQPGYTWHEPTKSFIKRVNYNRDGKEAFMNAIMECIKYHFEPSGMHVDGSADIDLMLDILPGIKGKPLYRKFGAFHAGTKDAHEHAKLLNYNSDLDGFMDEELELSAHEVIIHPDTGAIVEQGTFRYFIISLASVWFNAADEYRPRISKRHRKHYLRDAVTVRESLQEMLNRSIDRVSSIRKHFLTNTA